MALRLQLIRHAATQTVGQNLFVGSTDLPASERGLRELDRLHGFQGRIAPQSWFCSPMRRTLQTARELQRIFGIEQELVIDGRLREMDFGLWEMKSFQDIAALDPELVTAWAGGENFCFPEGESFSIFCSRIAGFLDEVRQSGAKEAAVITHGGVIRTMICLALGLAPKNYLLFNVAPGSMSIIDLYPEGGVLAGLNL